MADYSTSFHKTLGHEGGYGDDPDDRGGETYKGISRRYHPDWPGWGMIDQLKGEPSFPSSLYHHEELRAQVAEFYREEFWNRIWAEQIPDQDIADELFDTSVNLGVKRAVEFLQKGLNILNRNERLYDDIKEDGKFGHNTLTALKAYLNADDASYLLKVCNILQGMHYIEFMKASPTQEKYARGWLSRVKL